MTDLPQLSQMQLWECQGVSHALYQECALYWTKRCLGLSAAKKCWCNFLLLFNLQPYSNPTFFSSLQKSACLPLKKNAQYFIYVCFAQPHVKTLFHIVYSSSPSYSTHLSTSCYHYLWSALYLYLYVRQPILNALLLYHYLKCNSFRWNVWSIGLPKGRQLLREI